MAGEKRDAAETARADNDFMKQMLDLIPPQFYFVGDVTAEKRKQIEDDTWIIAQSAGNEKGKKRGQKRPADEEPRQSRQTQWKKAKFDPTLIPLHTVSKIQEQLVEREEQDKKGKKKKKKNKLKGPDLNSSTSIDKPAPVLVDRPEGLEDLHEKLQAKIDILQAKRKAMKGQDWLEKKKLKRKESKLKLKMKIKAGKQNQVKGQPNVNGTSSKGPKSDKPIFNKEGKMVFSKFDFSEQNSKKKTDLPTGKSYKQLLEKVEKQKEKVDKLMEVDEDAAKTLKQKTAWKTAIQKAEGVKVKDNPELLKKALKRSGKKKEKSSRDWQDRKEKLEKRHQDSQDKRRKNIKAKKQSRIDKKLKKSKKKGHIIPGF